MSPPPGSLAGLLLIEGGGGSSMASIETTLLARWSRVRILVGAKDFSLLQNAHTGWGVQAAFI